MKIKIFIIIFSAMQAFAQIGVKNSFKLADELSKDPAVNNTFLGNGIIDLLVNNSELWAATGYGLNRTISEGEDWITFNSADYLSKGGISAMAAMDNNTIWIATAFDTSAQGEDLSAGGGLSYTQDGGSSWTHIGQPVDSREETEYSPTTTVIQNLTFDITFVDSTIWIASFGGGLRRSDDMGKTWQVVTTDGLAFSSGDYLNHRAFSLMQENGNLWYGSAEGISKSADNGATWQRFTHLNQDDPISGNFVVALAYQQATNTIWAATVEAIDADEVRAVSKSANGGVSWDVVLEGVFAHNFGFEGENVFVAADEGLFISDDGGENWYTLPPVSDTNSGEVILQEEYYSAAGQGTRWWFGNADGLATTNDKGNTWRIIRSFVSTRERTSPGVYAYPTAFSPSRGGITRFQYDIEGETDVDVKIFNFAMEQVTTITATESAPAGTSADRSSYWDGRDGHGNLVASGVYFFRAKIGKKVQWGKIVVIN
jgi:hypothetical protein